MSSTLPEPPDHDMDGDIDSDCSSSRNGQCAEAKATDPLVQDVGKSSAGSTSFPDAISDSRIKPCYVSLARFSTQLQRTLARCKTIPVNIFKLLLTTDSSRSSFKCDVCCKVFSLQFALNRHLATHFVIWPFRCRFCRRGFALKKDLDHHRFAHSFCRSFKCDICGKGFWARRRLNIHVGVAHSNGGSLKCNSCDRAFYRQRDLDWHRTNYSGCTSAAGAEPEGNVSKHPERLSSLDLRLATHLDEIAKKVPVSVPIKRQKRKSDSRALAPKADRADHPDIRPFKCSVCDKKFIHERSLKVHLTTHADNDPPECTGKRSPLTYHNSTHSNESTVKIQTISYTSKRISDSHISSESCLPEDDSADQLNLGLQRENQETVDASQDLSIENAEMTMLPSIKMEPLDEDDVGSVEAVDVDDTIENSVSTVLSSGDEYILPGSSGQLTGDDQPFECDDCGKDFDLKKDLDKHRVIHSDRRPFSCDECGKTFKRKGWLSEHLAIHNGSKKFTCDICERRFSRREDLNRHRAGHSDSWPYTCDICGKGFWLSKQLKSHVAVTHPDSRVLKCDSCDRMFHRRCDLDWHRSNYSGCAPTAGLGSEDSVLKHMNEVATHLSRLPLRCDVCGRGFCKLSSLDLHLASHTDEIAKKIPNISYAARQTRNSLDADRADFDLQEANRNCGEPSHELSSEDVDMMTPTIKLEMPDEEVDFESGVTVGVAGTIEGSVSSTVDEYILPGSSDELTRVTRPFQCGECGKDFLLKKNLDQHRSTHTDTWPFRCNVCGRMFKQKLSMTVHLATHVGGEQSEPKNSFSIGEELRTHSDVVARRAKQPPNCIRTYSKRLTSDLHPATNSGEIPNSQASEQSANGPSKCIRTYGRRSTLDRRPATHSDEIAKQMPTISYASRQFSNSLTSGKSILRPRADCADRNLPTENPELAGPSRELTNEDVEVMIPSIKMETPDELNFEYVETAGVVDTIENSISTVTSSVDEYILPGSTDQIISNQKNTRQLPSRLESETDRPFQCKVCDKRFALLKEFYRHHMSHSDDRPFQCNVCGLKFMRMAGLTLHLQHSSLDLQHAAYTKEIALKIPKISYSARRISNSQASGKPDLLDPEGDSAAQSDLNLRNTNEGLLAEPSHELSIEDAKLMIPTIKMETPDDDNDFEESDEAVGVNIIEKSFPTVSNLEDEFILPRCSDQLIDRQTIGDPCQLESQSDTDRPYQCGVCGKRFCLRKQLGVHSVTHSNSRPFVCDVCGKTFKRKLGLSVHMALHTGS